MRHMYNRDGMIPYAGKVRASRRWKGSGTRSERFSREEPRKTRETIVAAEVRLANQDHKDRIAAILAGSKWSNHDYTQG